MLAVMCFRLIFSEIPFGFSLRSDFDFKVVNLSPPSLSAAASY